MITNKEIDHGKAFDWGRASSDYARFRDIYPEEFYRRIMELGLCVKGQRVLDLGTGTGVLPRNLYRYGADFVGADVSENQIAAARRLSEEAGMAIEYVVASAENFDLPAGSFDVVTACQCFQYFDKPVALPRIHQALKSGGHFAVLFMAWLPDESAIAARTEELVLRHNPAWTGGGMKRVLPDGDADWASELFQCEKVVGFDLDVPFTHESWHGRIRACRGIGASSLSPEEIAAFEEEHLTYLEHVPEEFTIPHYATILKLRKI